MTKYKADFLYPSESGSLESLGYELVNAQTEEYRKKIWEQIKEVERQRNKLFNVLEMFYEVHSDINSAIKPSHERDVEEILNEVKNCS